MNCPVLKPSPFCARFRSSKGVLKNREFTKDMASLSPTLLFWRERLRSDIISPEWLIIFISYSRHAYDSCRLERLRLLRPINGTTLISLTIESSLTPVFSRL